MSDKFNIYLLINAKLQPYLRGDLEDNLASIFDEYGVEAEIIGGGTFLNDDNTISSCDISIAVDGAENFEKIIDLLTRLPFPKGSSYTVTTYEDEDCEKPVEGEKIDIGNLDCLAVELDAEPEAYEGDVLDDVIDAMLDVLDAILWSYDYKENNVILYFYGDSFSDMQKCLDGFENNFKLCKGMKVYKI